MSTYAEKLKDPRWQKKRLEVMNEADWKCALCASETTTLNVHHPEYIPNREPWEYDNLVCLCQECHKKIHAKEPKAPSDLGHVIARLSGVMDSLDLLPEGLRQAKKREIWAKILSMLEVSGIEISDDLKSRFTA